LTHLRKLLQTTTQGSDIVCPSGNQAGSRSTDCCQTFTIVCFDNQLDQTITSTVDQTNFNANKQRITSNVVKFDIVTNRHQPSPFSCLPKFLYKQEQSKFWHNQVTKNPTTVKKEILNSKYSEHYKNVCFSLFCSHCW